MGIPVRSKLLLVIALFAAGTGAIGQTSSTSPDWQEPNVPPAPPSDDRRLIPIDMPANVTLRFGIDPDTLMITPDGVIRYVLVASSTTGVRNLMYEGLRCASSEVTTYARQNAVGQWTPASEPQWRALQGGNAASAHAMALARQGACSGRTVGADSVRALVKKLKSPRPDQY